jgi:hypothetical protein
MIVAKDLTEFELIKRARMKELQQKIDVRKRFERDYNHMIDTGVSLNLENYREPNELESFLNKQNVDANLQRLLVTDLGATVYTAKQFIQSLDITLKERLLERFPIFKKVFEDNFTKATAQNLQATHSMLTIFILKTEQKSSLPNLTQIKNFVGKKITGQDARAEFRDILNKKTGMESRSYIGAIDNLFYSFKGSYLDALAWLNKALEDNFLVVDMPIINVENKSDIRSSMITEATPMEETPMEKIPKLKSRSKLPKAIKIKSRGKPSKRQSVGFFKNNAGEQAEEQEV